MERNKDLLKDIEVVYDRMLAAEEQQRACIENAAESRRQRG